MNARLLEKLAQLNAAVDLVEQELSATQDALEKKSAAHEHLLQQYWSHGKKLALLESQGEEYDALAEENKRLRESQRQLRERLQRLLESTKLLGEALRQ